MRSWPERSGSIAPLDLAVPDWLVEALHGDEAAVGKPDALAAAEIVHAGGHDDAIRLGTRAQPRGLLHGCAKEIVLLGDRLPGRHPDTHMQVFLATFVAFVESALDLDRCGDGLEG